MVSDCLYTGGVNSYGLRRCEYILYRGLYRTAYARLSRGEITDTELQVGRFVVPRQPVTNETDSHESRYLRSWKENLPEDHVSMNTGGLLLKAADIHQQVDANGVLW
jgi:hypothetical protein